MVAQNISHYKIIEKIGEGGMGIIFKAEDLKLKRTVALKVLPESFTNDEESKQRFINEARTASALQHNNICTIHDIDETSEKQLFIVMDCYEGESLKDKISRGPMNLEQALDILIQIGNGLSKAHEKGIIHRDIKPANIFITNDGVVKILDFGLAKLLRSQTKLTKTGLTLGTVSYMSPEQICGYEADNRTDIWSLGIILYEMLNGLPPFEGEYEQAIMYSIMNEEPEFITKVRNQLPVKIRQICEVALSKNRDKRYQTIEEMLVELRTLREELKSGDLKKGLPKIFISRKKRRIAYKILTMAIAIIALLCIYFWQGRSAKIKPASVALMPLLSITPNVEQEWFTDGITDALITSLAKISGLKVISRSSVMKFKGSDKSPSDIGKELGVSYLIEGSVIRIGEQIKISTRLIDAASNNYLWAQDYERDFKNILSLQSEVASTIARQIRVKLTPYEQQLLSDKREVNPKAYDAYLEGNFYLNKPTPQSLETALKYYELAVELDSTYALGYAGIASVWVYRAQMGYEPYNAVIRNIEPAASKALELDSTLAEVHYTIGIFSAWEKWNWEKSKSAFEKAIKINPNFSDARAAYSHVLSVSNQPEEGMRQIEKALNLDPFNSLFQGLYAMDLMYVHRYDDVIRILEKVRSSDPRDPIAISTLRSAYHQKRMYKKALEMWRISFEVRKDNEAIDALNKGDEKGGYSLALQNIAELMIKRSKTQFVTPWQIATLYIRAGLNDKALDWFEKAYEAHDPNMPYLNIDPVFDKIRQDPRIKELIKKMGLENGS